ncbi:fimbria/pilus outer membrane usher protein [Sphingomonas glaciei]|uniref:Fimbria/pilus outer membrane usher protein n=1 Tax=Sphingomonas glaciei TaxID=2938948 RepID=A0ABY5MQQ4_9SPHN|nr:fimbria/pilus outer membrane usher protein [Sphingomonas glaciei]UUR06834.1 fimbria/pilus outer membrane usher protein [Sphingomonas glaciei]
MSPSLLAAVTLVSGTQAAAPAYGRYEGASISVAEAASLKPVGLVLNGLAQDRPSLAGIIEGELLVLRDDLLAIGLLIPTDLPVVTLEGQVFARVGAVPGLSGQFDEDAGMVSLSASLEAFKPTLLRRMGRKPPPAVGPVVPTAFLGYDLSLAGTVGHLRAGGLLDLGTSGRWGVVGTTALLQPGAGRPVRLESSLRRDLPARRLRLVLGDTFTRGGDFNTAVRYGGIRLGTDFSLSPGEINFPVPIVSGSALLPSTVELLAASGRQTHQVGAGRFLIDAPPTINGAGEVTVTIEDATGAVRQLRQNFYSSAKLLRPGLDDFSLEAGLLRRRYGLRSFAYGDAFAAASWRRGLSQWLTAGARIEASRVNAMAGMTLVATPLDLAEVAVTAVASRNPLGSGRQWRAQFQRRGRRGALTASYRQSSAAFAQVGDVIATRRGHGRHDLSATAGLTLPVGEVSVGLVDARLRDGTGFQLRTLSYSATFRNLYLFASLRSSRFAQGTDRGFFLSVSRALGTRRSAAVTAEQGQVTTSFQQSGQSDGGLNFGIAATRGQGGDRFNGYLIARSGGGDLELQAARSPHGYDLRASVHGGLVFIKDRLIRTAQIENGLAVVEVAGDREVQVFREGRPVAVRAGAGRTVVLTGLQPYAVNRIAIRTDDLPLDVELDEDEKAAVPGFRQAAMVRFGRAGLSMPLTARLVDRAGNSIAAGLDVFLNGARAGLTGLDGLVFLKGADKGGAVAVGSAGGQRCEARLPARIVPSSDGIAGPYPCIVAKRMEQQK